MRKTKAERANKLLITKIYSRYFNGIPVDIMNISPIYRAIEQAIAADNVAEVLPALVAQYGER